MSRCSQQRHRRRYVRLVGVLVGGDVDHRGQRGAVVVTELAHDRQREAQPPATLLRTVNRPQQPLDTLPVSTSPQKPGPVGCCLTTSLWSD
jgi:hypothetical protein